MSSFLFTGGQQLVLPGPVELHGQIFTAKIDGDTLTLESTTTGDRTGAKREAVHALNEKLQALRKDAKEKQQECDDLLARMLLSEATAEKVLAAIKEWSVLAREVKLIEQTCRVQFEERVNAQTFVLKPGVSYLDGFNGAVAWFPQVHEVSVVHSQPSSFMCTVSCSFMPVREGKIVGKHSYAMRGEDKPIDVAVTKDFVYVLHSSRLEVWFKAPGRLFFTFTNDEGVPQVFRNASALAVTSQNVIVADKDCVRVFSANNGKLLHRSEGFSRPTDVAASEDGEFYVIDKESTRIQVFSGFERSGIWQAAPNEFWNSMAVHTGALLVATTAFNDYVCSINLHTGTRSKLFDLADHESQHKDEQLHIAADADRIYVTAPHSQTVQVYRENNIESEFDCCVTGSVACDARNLFIVEADQVTVYE